MPSAQAEQRSNSPVISSCGKAHFFFLKSIFCPALKIMDSNVSLLYNSNNTKDSMSGGLGGDSD